MLNISMISKCISSHLVMGLISQMIKDVEKLMGLPLEKVLLIWMDFQLKKAGYNLPKISNWKQATKPLIKMPFRKVENCNQVIQIGKELNVSLVNVAGNDIVQGNKKLILGQKFLGEMQNMVKEFKNLDFHTSPSPSSASIPARSPQLFLVLNSTNQIYLIEEVIGPLS
ncbi:hypothetical protein TEA_019301 [Camellia sinensis var. sinensis]|uniref:Calponin-homology (CH) domain-containing protein n=1 Tax=Camellia sinensis var. sinensis TaxID=542762 RepID=A0A4V3WP04_CAMSN|nr:hypothetical protein TEA_019301 [Camellia sinensis var. sinensis]